MKKFETPDLEIVRFDVADVITTSGDDPIPSTPSGGAGTELPPDEF